MLSPAIGGGAAFAWLVACGVASAVVACIRPPRLAGWGVFGLALVVRLVPALIFRMPASGVAHFDLESYGIVADIFRSGADVYAGTPRHPYLPLYVYWLALSGWLSAHSVVPFEVLVKLPGIVADAVIAALLAVWPSADARPAARAGLVYALNPVSTLVVALHGQFDSLPLVAALLSLRCLVARRPSLASVVAAGALLGLAVLAKSWAIILAPIAVWQVHGWRRRLAFSAAFVLVPCVGVLVYCAWMSVGPAAMLDRVAHYQSLERRWGYPLLLKRFGRLGFAWAAAAYDLLLPWRELVLAGGLLMATLLALPLAAEAAFTLVILGFYLWTYGWGAHYLMWVQPFLLLCVRPGLAVSYSLAASVFLLLSFFGLGGFYATALYVFPQTAPIYSYTWTLSVPLWLLSIGLFVSVARQSPTSV